MNSKELYAIREWAPLTDVIERIPARVQRGLFSVDLNISCIDAVAEFLALGTDAGIVFWYNRHSGEVQKLRAETNARISCVKIVNSVEYMVAAGNSNGQVSVFQIQKPLPADLNLVAPCTRNKPVQRYTIRELHRSAVTCCEWSKNGMKLYSGDRQGVVVLTEIDYQMHLSKSALILSEAYEIVQLSVHQSYLLVSTLYRSIVCQRKRPPSTDWHITQVGQKDRKQLVDCGGTFLKNAVAVAGQSPELICARPGLRCWLADVAGNVSRTLLFKEAVAGSANWQIPLLNPKYMKTAVATDSTTDSTVASCNFSCLHLYGGSDALLITHDDQARLYILNVQQLRVEAVAKGFRKITDICVCDKEIFVLEGERSLLRLAPMPEKPNKIARIIFNPLMPPPVPVLGIHPKDTLPECADAPEALLNAVECFELPPIEELNLNVPIELAVESPRAAQNRRLEIFQQIAEQEFDSSIVHHSGGSAATNGKSKRKGRERQTKSEGIVEIAQAASASVVGHAKLQQTKREKPKQLSFATNEATTMEASFCLDSSATLKQALSAHLPATMTPATLKRTIEMKAEQLAAEMNIPTVQLAAISAEELRLSQALAKPPNTQAWQLPLEYPQLIDTTTTTTITTTKTQVEDAGVQTTPRKPSYVEPELCDFSAGLPVEDICQTLCLSSRNEDLDVAQVSVATKEDEDENKANTEEKPVQGKETQPIQQPLQFVSAPPSMGEEIDSFMLDFRRAGDPLHHSPPPSAESNNSSEWEFLDN